MNDKRPISDMGEDYLLKWLAKYFPTFRPEIILGSGDDAAILSLAEGENLLVTTDSLVEGVHFRREWMGTRDLAWRSLTQNVSDIAAMGGEPVAALVALIAPSSLTWGEFQNLAAGLKEGEEEYGLQIAGGNLSRGEKLALTVTLLGQVKKGEHLCRQKARPGDRIWITGYLGEARAGVKALEKGQDHLVIEKYRRPRARVREIKYLSSQAKITSLMDLSDGLYRDLPRLLGEWGGRIEARSIPLSKRLKDFCSKTSLDPVETAILGGEDFELVFTSSDHGLWNLKEAFEKEFSLPLASVGEVTEESRIYWRDGKGEEISFEEESFEHFQE